MLDACDSNIIDAHCWLTTIYVTMTICRLISLWYNECSLSISLHRVGHTQKSPKQMQYPTSSLTFHHICIELENSAQKFCKSQMEVQSLQQSEQTKI